jgi:hypothetical protein
LQKVVSRPKEVIRLSHRGAIRILVLADPTMLIIYAITANLGAGTSALAGSAGQESALALLAFGVLGANMAVLTAAMLRLMLRLLGSVSLDNLDDSELQLGGRHCGTLLLPPRRRARHYSG